MIRVETKAARGDFTLNVVFETKTHVTGVFGPSGAGKTTLMNLIAGLEHPDEGSIAIDEETLFDANGSIDVPPHRRRIGVVFQEHRLFPHYDVQGNLKYGARDHRRSGDHNPFDDVVDMLELGPLLPRRVTNLSGGERQRVALGRALMSNPKLLLLDEPLASLDVRLRQQIIPYLQRVRDSKRVPMLYISHDLTEMLQLTDDLLVIDRGKLVGHGRYHDLVHEQAVFSVVHDRGMRNVLAACVRSHRPEDGITELDLVRPNEISEQLPQTLSISHIAAQVGDLVSIAIEPWDIALATSRIGSVSIQNQIEGQVMRVTMLDRNALVEVDIGALINVEVSRKSAHALEVEEGKSIICLIKSHAIRHVGSIA